MTGTSPTDDGPVLVLDIGTSAVKAAVVDDDAHVVRTGTARQRTLGDGPAGQEHDPAETWRAVATAIREALAGPGDPAAIRAIAVMGPRGSFCIVDSSGRPTTAVVTWQDRRAADVAADLATRAASGYRSIAGTRLDASTVLPKIVWLRSRRPEIFGGGWQATTPQGLVLARLGAGEQVVDLTTAAHFGLLDVRQLAWSEPLLDTYEVPVSALPKLVPPGAVVGRLEPGIAASLGLPAGIPIVAAGSDGVCSELGAGVVSEGQLYAYLGSASAVAGPVASPTMPPDHSLIVMPGSSPDVWRILGLAGAGGSARDWLMTSIHVRSQARVERLIAASPPGSGGVLFIPTLAGASAPVPDGRARGVFLGLTLRSSSADLARAVHEGVAFEIAALVRAMRGTVSLPTEVRLTGGGSRSDAWVQIIADVLGTDVARVREPNPGLRGGAIYALTALGRHPDVRSAAAALEPELERFEPDLECGMLYQEGAEIYATVRGALHEKGIDERLFRWTSADHRPGPA